MQNDNLRSSDAFYSTHGIPQNVRMKGRRNKPDSYNSFRFQTAFCRFQAVASMIRFRPFRGCDVLHQYFVPMLANSFL